MREAEVDAVIDGLVSLRDGKDDGLGKILAPAIKLLKDYRKQRHSMRKLMGQLGAIKSYSQNNLKLVQELRGEIFGGKKRKSKI